MNKLKYLSLESVRSPNGNAPAAVRSNTEGAFFVGTATVNHSGDTVFNIAPTPVMHPNARSAAAEAERLARQNPGKHFTVLQLRGAAKVATHSWA